MSNDKVLVIDDEQSIVQAIYRQLMLEEENYEIFSANNGKEGLEIYYREKPSLVILDLNMPVMGGLDFLERIKISASDPCSVIVLTGHSDDGYIKNCFELGVSAFLKKPFNDYEFMGLVRHSMALKKTQQELKEEITRRELAQEALNNQREKFISVLMHDLKNPLIPIEGYTRRLLEGKVKSEEDNIEKFKIIKEASQNLLRIIKNTSDALKEKSDLQSFNSEDVEFKNILLSVVMNYMSEIEDRELSIFINGKDKGKWNEIEKFNLKADPYQLKTLTENLLGNAIKYAKSSINVELSKFDSEILFVIADDGPGIEKIYHDKIFEEYFQVPGSKKGTGLGLFSVIKAVENHNAKITVNSSPDAGTSFRVVFPVTEDKENGR